MSRQEEFDTSEILSVIATRKHSQLGKTSRTVTIRGQLHQKGMYCGTLTRLELGHCICDTYLNVRLVGWTSVGHSRKANIHFRSNFHNQRG